MPNVVDIIQSIQVPQLIKDGLISKGSPMLDSRNRPLHFTGGFAVVFPFLVEGEKWAFRCWSADIGNVEKRLHTLSAELTKLHLPYFCNFAYEPLGIVINGVTYPTTRMQWVDGKNIKDYLCENKDDSDKIKKLAEDFLQMCRTLHKNAIAHGDLQHGNILVDDKGKLFLIDYDSAYLPALQGEDDIISGLPDYQHPERKNNKIASEKLDYFSELIIYLSICSIAENPSLVDKYQLIDADRLLFSREDFLCFKQSEIFQDISILGTRFQELLDVIDGYLCKHSIDELKPFYEVVLDKMIEFKVSSDKVVRNEQEIVVEWRILYESTVKLYLLSSNVFFDYGRFGQYKCKLSGDETFEIEIESDDGIIVRKRHIVRAFDECKIEFTADRSCVFPTFPVKLNWKVVNGDNVKLDSEDVEMIGSKVVLPIKNTVYVLSAQDEFGIKNCKIEIQTFPMKQLRVLLAPPPSPSENSRFQRDFDLI